MVIARFLFIPADEMAASPSTIANEPEISRNITPELAQDMLAAASGTEPSPASPEPKDGAKDPTKFADWQKYYAAQAIARYKLLTLQQCAVVIPGNAEICAGDRVDIRLINKAPASEVQKQGNEIDIESSGLYLAGEVTHTYDKTKGKNGQFLTTIKLTRDSYGMKGEQSLHGK